MLPITILGGELFDETNEEIINVKPTKLQLEHSLVSVSKWEKKWHKPFLDDKYEKTTEMILDYIKCMTITQNVDPNVYLCINQQIIDKIFAYINDPMTACWFADEKGKKSRETITYELIYYWMIELGIPFECEKWHLNALLALIRVCSIKKTPPKKMSRSEILSRNKALNDARRAKYNSRG